MYIQYVGFDGTADSRIYNFHVIDAPHESREFAVEVQSEVFQRSQLRLQDGPAISFACLKRRLEEETERACAERHLNVSEEDVHLYLDTHRSVKPPGKRRQDALATEPNGTRARSGLSTRTHL